MGWSGGTELFDNVVEMILDESKKTSEEKIESLINILEDMDWDVQNESEYFEDPIVNGIFRKLHPDWDFD